MITYEFPVTEYTGDDPDDAYTTMHTASLDVEELMHEPYEATLYALDDTYKLIFGHCHDGFYLCIPNKGFGCTLDSMSYIDENHYMLLHASELDPILFDEATAIAYALNELYKVIKVHKNRA